MNSEMNRLNYNDGLISAHLSPTSNLPYSSVLTNFTA
jgi:hypothetical protein